MIFQKYKKYSRKEIYFILFPNEILPKGGAWGAQGIVPIKNTNDYIFFVTLGSEQAGHIFKEYISFDGILTWQSQPRQDLQNKTIKIFINHNEIKENIYLFLRIKKSEDYYFLGKLKYLEHNEKTSKPVHFKWQILDWNPPIELRQIIPSDNNDDNFELQTKTILPNAVEGKKVAIYGTKYERNPTNRNNCIKIHGTICKVCGFDFYKKYGEWGKEFIEVHHKKPLFNLEEEIIINPKTDLIPVCSNCHRMLHRKKYEILTVEQLKELIDKNT